MPRRMSCGVVPQPSTTVMAESEKRILEFFASVRWKSSRCSLSARERSSRAATEVTLQLFTPLTVAKRPAADSFSGRMNVSLRGVTAVKTPRG